MTTCNYTTRSTGEGTQRWTLAGGSQNLQARHTTTPLVQTALQTGRWRPSTPAHAVSGAIRCYPWVCDPQDTPRLMGWCKRKLKALACDHARKPCHQREVLLLNAPNGETLAPYEINDALIEGVAMAQFLESLPAYLRTVAALYNTGYTCREIAERLGISVGTVKGYLSRIVRLEREFFGLAGTRSAFCLVSSDEARGSACASQTH